MLVEDIMVKNVHTLPPTATVSEATRIMHEKKIRHLPVIDEHNHVLGIVTQRIIKEALPSSLRDKPNSPILDATVEEIMIKDPVIGHPLDFVEEVALTFYDARISCLPIVSGGKLVGIVTTSDLLYTYIELTGAHLPGSKIDIRVTDTPGVLHEITKVFSKHQVNVQSLLVFPDSKDDTKRILTVRIQTLNPLTVIEDLRNDGFDVLWPHVPGVAQ